MASTQQIKARIKSVRSTKQITKAMELVSASKMRRAQEAALASREYTKLANQLLTRLRELMDVDSHPLFVHRSVKNRMYVVITSDRGLAGAYNSNVLRLFASELKADKEQGVTSSVLLIGKQAAKFASKLEGIEIIGAYDHFTENPTAEDIAPILSTVIKQFTADTKKKPSAEDLESMDAENAPAIAKPKVDAVDIIYTDYKSSIIQQVTKHRLLPAAFTEVPISADLEAAIFEPSPQAVLEQVAERLIEVQLLQAILESQASEQSARMMAMKTASDNAGDLIDDLTLAANTARQSAITQELAEITGGAEAIK